MAKLCGFSPLRRPSASASRRKFAVARSFGVQKPQHTSLDPASTRIQTENIAGVILKLLLKQHSTSASSGKPTSRRDGVSLPALASKSWT
jgi:tRNA A-37 threonylcarbamoyl transferase component Bud32